jgi:hypothetical protein
MNKIQRSFYESRYLVCLNNFLSNKIDTETLWSVPIPAYTPTFFQGPYTATWSIDSVCIWNSSINHLLLQWFLSIQFFRINGIRGKRPQNYDPIASHTGQIQTQRVAKGIFDSKISLIPRITLNKPKGLYQGFPFQQSHSFATDQWW